MSRASDAQVSRQARISKWPGPVRAKEISAVQRSLPSKVIGTRSPAEVATAAANTSWPSPKTSADTVIGQPSTAFAAKRPPSMSGSIPSMTSLRDARSVSCSADALRLSLRPSFAAIPRLPVPIRPVPRNAGGGRVCGDQPVGRDDVPEFSGTLLKGRVLGCPGQGAEQGAGQAFLRRGKRARLVRPAGRSGTLSAPVPMGWRQAFAVFRVALRVVRAGAAEASAALFVRRVRFGTGLPAPRRALARCQCASAWPSGRPSSSQM
jgi:hypothetical protein